MIGYILKHMPILQLLIPFFGSLFIVPCMNIRLTRRIFQFSAAIGLLLSGFGLFYMENATSYALGGWRAPFGIVFYLDVYNQLLIFYSYFILFFVSFAVQRLFIHKVESLLDVKYQRLLYVFILLFHFASVGICSTDDLFNLYVFLEISSLAAYALFSVGSRGAAVTALEYLIIGTIAATFLLVGVGVIFSQTGHLNMELNKEWLMQMNSSAHYLSLSFIFLAVAIKLSLFPFHCWLSRCYQYVSLPLMTYLPSIASMTSIYIISKIIFYLVGDNIFYEQGGFIVLFLSVIGMLTIIYMSLMASFARDIREILSYSSISQLGYVLVILGSIGDLRLVIALIIADGAIKSALFYMMSMLDVNDDFLHLRQVQSISRKLLYMICVILFFSSSLPLSSGFIIKFTILSELFSSGQFYIFYCVIGGSVVNLWYHYRVMSLICFRALSDNYDRNHISVYGQYSISTLQGELVWIVLPVVVSFSTIMILWL